MQGQFTQHSNFSATSSGYNYEEPTPPFWRRLLPFAIVLVIGGTACYGGLHIGKKMAGEVTQLHTVQADPRLVQRATIGEEDPDLMIPHPTLPPPVMAVSQSKPAQRSSQSAKTARLASKPSFDPFTDNSIPFRPAEDYTPGIEHEKHESAVLEQEPVEQAVLPVSETLDKTPVEHPVQENTSPVPVAEPGFN